MKLSFNSTDNNKLIKHFANEFYIHASAIGIFQNKTQTTQIWSESFQSRNNWMNKRIRTIVEPRMKQPTRFLGHFVEVRAINSNRLLPTYLFYIVLPLFRSFVTVASQRQSLKACLNDLKHHNAKHTARENRENRNRKCSKLAHA